MAKLLKLRRGTTTQHGSFTGAEGEVTIDTTKDTAVVHDGSTAGGTPLAKEDLTNVSSSTIAGRLNNDSIAVSKIAAGTLPSDVKIQDANVSGNLTIVNADVASSAAIAGTKISPNFGSQQITTTGNIVVGGTVDGRDVASDGSKLDGIESGSTGDQTAAEIRTLVESASDSNVFTDADHNKLNGIESGATGDQTNAEIRAAVEAASDSNVFTDADHSKLNGIESGATADQTKSDIDALNINADTVDSLHAASFLRSDTGDTAAGDISFGGGAGAVTISANSDIRLVNGSWTGDYGAKLQHHSNWLYVQGGSSGTRIRQANGSNSAVFDSSGNFTAVGNVTAYSDARLKTDIHTINDALGICGKLRGVSYKWIRDGKPSIGVIAQEVEEVIPEVVLTSHDVDPSTGEVEEIKSVDYGKLVGVLINAINELKEEVEELKNAKITG